MIRFLYTVSQCKRKPRGYTWYTWYTVFQYFINQKLFYFVIFWKVSRYRFFYSDKIQQQCIP